MTKRKTKQKRKHTYARKIRKHKKTTNSKKKSRLSKRKQRAISKSSRRRKKRTIKARSISRRKAKPIRKASRERKFINSRNKGAIYSIRTLRARLSNDLLTEGQKFKIKKKVKNLRASKNIKASLLKMGKDAKKYLRLSSKKAEQPKIAYLKVAFRDTRGNINYASVARQPLYDSNDMMGAINVLLMYMRQYGEVDILGYEIEQVTEIEEL